MFFNDYPDFRDRENGWDFTLRLNHRYNAIIAENDFTGKEVLDLGSHNGRWAFAASKAGAKKVTAVEGRAFQIEKAKKITTKYGASNIDFVHEDIHEFINKPNQKYDIILCLGWIYHSHSICWSFQKMTEMKPSLMVIDTEVHNDCDGPAFLLKRELSENPWNAIDEKEHALVQKPNIESLSLLAEQFEMSMSLFDWGKYLQSLPDSIETRKYKQRKRVTAYFEPNQKNTILF